MQKNEAVAHQKLFRGHLMVDQNLTVLFCAHNFIIFDKIPDTHYLLPDLLHAY